MIPLDKLKSVTHLVTHANCPDGIASALIIKDALPDVKVSFMSYNTTELAALPAGPGMLFCDFTPPRERVQEFVAAGTIVLDHHPTAKDIVEAFGENGVFGENDNLECGAWLAYTQVWFPLYIANRTDLNGLIRNPHGKSYQVETFAQLAAIRDTWKKDDPLWRAACEQAASLIFWGFEDSVLIGQMRGGVPYVGSRLVDKQLSAAQRSLDEGHHFTTTRGTAVSMFQGVSTTSDAAELAEQQELCGPSTQRTDLIVGFHYRCDVAVKLQLQFSMRSHTGYDCASFAKAHGGGGHKAAAGFTVEVGFLDSSPYLIFHDLLQKWESCL